MNTATNKIQVLSQFDRSIRLNLVRFGTKQFGHVCAQTGRKLFFTCKTRLDAAVLVAGRYGTHQSDADGASVNPKCVAAIHGIDLAVELLLGCGFIKVQDGRWVIATEYNIDLNQ